MFQTVADSLFICGPVVYSAGKQEPWQTVSKWCAWQRFPLWLLSQSDWQPVCGCLTCSSDKRLPRALGTMISVVQQDSGATEELLFIIMSLLLNSLFLLQLKHKQRILIQEVNLMLGEKVESVQVAESHVGLSDKDWEPIIKLQKLGFHSFDSAC